MKRKLLSTSRLQATDLLRSSLSQLPSDALKLDDQLSAYGEVTIKDEETTFDIGMGPSSRVGAKGKIREIEPNKSELTYQFYGPFWAFLDRYPLSLHLKATFSKIKTIK
ncbi:hypothetical protein IEN85_10175 [Pelagicoccus sp. NFK12]|uniref:Uncharacterized protein n=1 Tax=Pelagicoccus enzymogenes TaxID=2773457 RepID=A0A927F9X1_9BACT|nr:hypothetical protein [Pelagicoccus enzymogenes]MBD5779855.1 hypothetical protein [Pelagicoccus enzymogenes]